MKYKKRLNIVDAFQWTGEPNQTEDPLWVIELIKKGRITFPKQFNGNVEMHIDINLTVPEFLKTEHFYSILKVRKGEYVVRDELGQISVYTPENFVAKYEVDTLNQDVDIKLNIIKIMSTMLDNPDENGIYPTAKFINEMEIFIKSLIYKDGNNE